MPASPKSNPSKTDTRRESSRGTAGQPRLGRGYSARRNGRGRLQPEVAADQAFMISSDVGVG